MSKKPKIIIEKPCTAQEAIRAFGMTEEDLVRIRKMIDKVLDPEVPRGTCKPNAK